MYSDSQVNELLEKAVINRKEPNDDTLVKLKPFDLRDSRANLLESHLSVFAPTEGDFTHIRRGLDVSHRYHFGKENSIFSSSDIMVDFLKTHKCAFVGGFVTSMLCETVYRDIDIMFYDSATYEQVMDAAKDLTERLLRCNHHVRLVKTSSSLSLVVDAPFEYEEFQFVYRQFRNKADILYNMDLGSCQCMWDGTYFLGTPIARECLNYGVNIFDLSEWGPYKEERLVKYFNNGFAVIFLELDYSAISDQGDYELPHIKLQTEYSHGLSHYFICGTMEAKELTPEQAQMRKEQFFGYLYQPHVGHIASTWQVTNIALHNMQQSKQTSPAYVLYKNNIKPEDVYEVKVTIDLADVEVALQASELDEEQFEFNSSNCGEFNAPNCVEFNALNIELSPEMRMPDKYRRTITPEEWYGAYFGLDSYCGRMRRR